MLYNIKTLPLHCVFHGIRFKVNEDWVSVIDTLLFLRKTTTPNLWSCRFFLCFCLVSHAWRYPEGCSDGRQDRDGDVDDFLPDFFFHKLDF